MSRVWGLDDLNLKNDDFRTPIDMIHSVLGRIDVKSSALNPEDVVDRYVDYGRCVFHTNRKKECDTYILLCYDSKRKNIFAVYIIPNDEKVKNMPFITIRNGTRKSKYDKFRVDHSHYNGVYHSLDFDNDPVLKHIFL